MWAHRASLAVAAMLTLCCGVARSDDARKPPPDPDPGFLEFLGSVDRLADVNPDYLSHPDPPGTKPGARNATPPPPPPPPPPPRQPLPPSASAASGGPNNE